MIRYATYGLYIFLFAIIFIETNAQTDYCKIQCSNPNEKQTMCKYPSSSPSSKCNKVIRTQVTDREKQLILNKHNSLRAFVAAGNEKRGNPGPQPASDDLKNMVWDDELATVAQRWANQCDFGHDKCRNVGRFSVGQNIASSSTTGTGPINVENLVQSWYEEVKSLDKDQVKKFTGKNLSNVGHYTQLVWAKSTNLGCGISEYIDKNNWKTLFLVCNYGPAGNWIGEPIYHVK